MKLTKTIATAIALLSVLGSGFTASMLKPSVAKAQNNIVLFGNKENNLPYVIRNKNPGASRNYIKFYATLPDSRAVAEVQIVYPQEFRSAFVPRKLTVRNRRSKEEYEVRDISVDRELNNIRIEFVEPIAALPNQEIEIVAKSVTNPRHAGMYRIEVQALGTEANPLFQYLGQWLVSIY
ncbi:hypothetical protein Pse7367_3639 [Thalassoporum mexicanum PCC 7367]|uniref:DUF2808 domain-containing protein n=1 Tax=Thalassoporum mexicanum TaxID=3457544 RepID=UPI00029F8921|nr:DUF2808 domain-containing protein [Pseudanabaena sp. PCC 7367]AFY71872.1 hypothetical protein Pse7367_3639 [Pseudanabaena sp. PCC 7367]